MEGGSWIDSKKKEILETPPNVEDLRKALITDKIQKRLHYSCKNNYVTLDSIPSFCHQIKDSNIYSSPLIKSISQKVSVWKGDIVALEIDAIVNAANEGLLGGGGIDEAIHKAAGPLLQRECANLPLCLPGNTVVTKGYLLPATYVLHTVAPYLDENNQLQPNILRNCYKSILQLVSMYRLHSVALTAIGTGFYGFPKPLAAKIAVEEVLHWLREVDNASSVDRIIFTAFSKQDYEAYEKALQETLYNLHTALDNNTSQHNAMQVDAKDSSAIDWNSITIAEPGTHMLGPTPTSNWVIKGHLLAGGYPGAISEPEHSHTVKSLLAAGRILSFDFLLTYLTGVNTFLCLQTESELQRFNPYKQLAQSLNPDVEFLHLPIPDQSVTSDDKVIGMVEEVYQRLKSNKIIYVHCWGGHGRTVTTARVYKLDGDTALKYTAAFHKCRVTAKSTSPQHPLQFEQVRRIAKIFAEEQHH